MGFPNVDIFLVKALNDGFKSVQMDTEFPVNDLFDDLDVQDRSDIATYIVRKDFTTDLRKRGGDQVFLMPHFPLLDMPLPQIGISLGQEDTAEKFLGDVVGEATPYPATGEQTHWDIPKGYWASARYQINIVAATKDETIWLARFVQRFICEKLDDLDQIGVKEVDISLADLKIEQDQVPMTVFSRGVSISCKVANTWTKRVPAQYYQTGVNLALP